MTRSRYCGGALQLQRLANLNERRSIVYRARIEPGGGGVRFGDCIKCFSANDILDNEAVWRTVFHHLDGSFRSRTGGANVISFMTGNQ